MVYVITLRYVINSVMMFVLNSVSVGFTIQDKLSILYKISMNFCTIKRQVNNLRNHITEQC